MKALHAQTGKGFLPGPEGRSGRGPDRGPIEASKQQQQQQAHEPAANNESEETPGQMT